MFRTIIGRYIAKKFFVNLLIVLGLFTLLIVLIGSLESLRKFSNYKGGDLLLYLSLPWFQLPGIIKQLMPFALSIACLITFRSMSANSEIYILKSAGMRLISILWPAVVVSILTSLVVMFLITKAVFFADLQFKIIEQAAKRIPGVEYEYSDNIMWAFQQQSPESYLIATGLFVDPKNPLAIKNAYVTEYKYGRPINSYVAASGAIDGSTLSLKDAYKTNPERTSYIKAGDVSWNVHFSSKVISSKAYENPNPFLLDALQTYIYLKKNNLRGSSHLYKALYELLTPLVYAAIVMISGTLALGAVRKENTIFLTVKVVVATLLIFVFMRLLHGLSLIDSINVFMVNVLPTISLVLFALFMIYKKEGGY